MKAKYKFENNKNDQSTEPKLLKPKLKLKLK